MYEQDKVVCFVCGSRFDDEGTELCENCGWKKCPHCGGCYCSLTPSEKRVALAQCISYHAPMSEMEWWRKYSLLKQWVLLTTDFEPKET